MRRPAVVLALDSRRRCGEGALAEGGDADTSQPRTSRLSEEITSQRQGETINSAAPRVGSRLDPACTEPAPPRVHALPVERATATVPDRQHRPDPEPDVSVFGDQGAVGFVHRVSVDAPDRSRSAPVERDLARAKPSEVVVEVLVRRLDYVVERLACSATAQA